ncbi:amidase [Nocardia sp. NPDC059091]|uniref:amidase n=1 Tax=Nocardia sp. NPDC059091 TaxID=3346724 RepID=UPI003676C120
MNEELWRKGAGELARLIREGEVSSTEVVTAHLARIEAVNPELNAITVVLAEQALAAANQADRHIAAGADLGPLHGVPVTVKENVDVAGTATTQGVPALADAVAEVDAPVVERLRAAGAIIIGRTNLPDLALRIATESSLRGITRNPWHRDRTAGGSSGGEGSAIAAGMSPLGIGNDIGGSLRNPAHCCGISSLKPTTGRIPHATVVEPVDGPLSHQLMNVEGLMARTVADVRLGYEIASGADPRDPFSVPAPLSFPDAANRTKVALIAEPPGGATDPGVAEVVRQAGTHLANAGYEVEEVAPPEYEAVLDLWRNFLVTELRIMQPMLDQLMGRDGKQFLFAVLDAAPPNDLVGYVGLFAHRRRLQRAWARFFRDYPLVLSPIWAQPAFAHGWDAATSANSLSALELLRPVMPANALGLPAAATTGGFAAGMPVGVQIIAPAFRDDTALAAAEVIQTAVGVHTPIDPYVNQ